jgi:hypothetical protein
MNTSSVSPLVLRHLSIESSLHHDQCQSLWVLMMNLPMLWVVHLLGQIDRLALFHSCMSELVGHSCGHLMSKFDTSGRQRNRISVFIMLPEAVKMSDMNKS